MTKNCAVTLSSKRFEPLPSLPGPCSLLQHDWLADRESADYRLPSPARVISEDAEQRRSQARLGPSEDDQGGLQSLTTSTAVIQLPSGTKWINLSSLLHLLQQYHGERVDRWQRVKKVVISWDWTKPWFVVFKAKSVPELLHWSHNLAKILKPF